MIKRARAAAPILRMPEGITLYFCRHGETEANVEKRFQGHTIDTPLTKKGRRQAKDLAEILAAKVKDPGALKYVCSPLHRAVLTMEIVRSELDLPVDKFTTEKKLREINLGSWDGLTHKEAKALDPAFYIKRESHKWDVRTPGGEDYSDVAKRIEKWITGLKRDTFAISHGGLTRIMRGLFQGLSADEMSDLDEPQGVVFRARGSKVKRYEKS